MNNKLKVMISSVVRDLESERDAIKMFFEQPQCSFVELVGANPYDVASLAESSSSSTVKMARDCDLYILILGNHYGWVTREGRSATEVEFDAAYRADPTKILIFLKDFDKNEIDEAQRKFINKVSNYDEGYFRTSFRYSHELQQKVESSFWKWLLSRVRIGGYQTYVDHFIRMVKEDIPISDIKILYRTFDTYVEFDVCFNNQKTSMHIQNTEILSNFWRNVNTVRMSILEFVRAH